MMIKLAKRTFSSSIYSWGYNLKNLGFVEDELTPTTLPKRLDFQTDQKIKKTVCGFENSLLLTETGTVFIQGNSQYAQNQASFMPMPKELELGDIDDVDCDQNTKIFATKSGKVYSIALDDKPVTIPLPINAQFVGAGKNFFIAAGFDDHKNTRVFAWAAQNWEVGPFLNGNDCEKSMVPFELTQLSQFIQKKKSSIKKMKIVNHSGVILLENGELISWGDNISGNLAVPRSQLSYIHNNVENAVEPLKLNELHEHVIDFDLSDNILVILTENGTAYFTGLNNVLKFQRIEFFKDKKVTIIGANFNHFYLKDENGKWYSNKMFDGQKIAKFYGEVGLYQIDFKATPNQNVHCISGKYDNALAF